MIDGAFTTSERLCDAAIDVSGGISWDAGGIGLQADLVVAGTLTDLAITSPAGDRHHALFIELDDVEGYELALPRLLRPAVRAGRQHGRAILAGGTWQIGLTGSTTQVSLALRARIADVPFQQQYCPPSQQNLV